MARVRLLLLGFFLLLRPLLAQNPTDATLLIICESKKLAEECKKIQGEISPWWRQRFFEKREIPQTKLRMRVWEAFGQLTIEAEVVENTIIISSKEGSFDVEIVTFINTLTGTKNENGINHLISELRKRIETRQKEITPQLRISPTRRHIATAEPSPPKGTVGGFLLYNFLQIPYNLQQVPLGTIQIERGNKMKRLLFTACILVIISLFIAKLRGQPREFVVHCGEGTKAFDALCLRMQDIRGWIAKLPDELRPVREGEWKVVVIQYHDDKKQVAVDLQIQTAVGLLTPIVSIRLESGNNEEVVKKALEHFKKECVIELKKGLEYIKSKNEPKTAKNGKTLLSG